MIVIGALDQDVNAAALMAVPETYNKGREGKYYTRPIFFGFVVDAIYQSVICFFIPWAMWGKWPATNADGHDMVSLYLFGTSVVGAAVTCANLMAAVVSNYWTWLFWVVEVVSILAFYLFSAIYSAFNSFIFDDVAYYLYASVLFWGTVAITVVGAMLPRFCFLAWHACFYPDDCHVVRERWVAGQLKDELGLPHRRQQRADKRKQAGVRKESGAIGSASEGTPDLEIQGLRPTSSSLTPTRSNLLSISYSRESFVQSIGQSRPSLQDRAFFEGEAQGAMDDNVWAQTIAEYDVGVSSAQKNGLRDDKGARKFPYLTSLTPTVSQQHLGDSRSGLGIRLVDPQPDDTQSLHEELHDHLPTDSTSYDYEQYELPPSFSRHPLSRPSPFRVQPRPDESGAFVGAQRSAFLSAQPASENISRNHTISTLSSYAPMPRPGMVAADNGLLGNLMDQLGRLDRPLSSLAPTLSTQPTPVRPTFGADSHCFSPNPSPPHTAATEPQLSTHRPPDLAATGGDAQAEPEPPLSLLANAGSATGRRHTDSLR